MFIHNWLFLDEGSPGGPEPGKSTSTADDKDKQTRSFTQAELDALFAERASQAERSTLAKLFKDLGIKDADEAKSLLKIARDAEAAKLTEAEKAQKLQKELEEKAAAAEEKAKAAEARAQETAMKYAVLLAAANFNDPNDAWTYVDREKLKINEKGEVEGAKEAVEAVAKAKPYLVKKDSKAPLGTPPRNPPSGKPSNDDQPKPVVVRL